MRRLASAFLTLWLLFFVPSLIVWVLVVRSSSAGVERYASVWHWVVNRMAYPLVLSPLTDRSWRALDAGSPVSATTGFLLLTIIWAAIFALPLVLISTWWRKIGDRMVGNTPNTAYSYADSGSTSALPIPGRVSSSPLAALYVITIPLALFWNGVRRLFGGAGWLFSGWFGTLVSLPALAFLVVIAAMALTFGLSNYWERYEILDSLVTTVWYGYLDTLRIPRIFHQTWLGAADQIYRTTYGTDYNDWPAYMGQWYRHEEFRTLVWITAARHALGVAMAIVIWKVIRRIFGGRT